MTVVTAAAGAREYLLRQKQAVGDHDRGIGTEIPEGSAVRGFLEVDGRQDRNVETLGSLVHRRFLEIEAAPPAGPRRLCIHGGNLVTRPGERKKRRHGKFRCTHEDDAKRQVTASVSFDCPRASGGSS